MFCNDKSFSEMGRIEKNVENMIYIIKKAPVYSLEIFEPNQKTPVGQRPL